MNNILNKNNIYIYKNIMAENVDVERKYIYLRCMTYNNGKFWECTVTGTQYYVRYGGYGGRVTEQMKNFASYEKALEEMNKKVWEKTTRGGYEIIDNN